MKQCALTVLLLLLISVNTHAAETSELKGDGNICLYNYHTGSILEISYKNNGKFNEKALSEINRIFRSRSDNKEISVDTDLIELLDDIQDHFKADCLELISGYRSPELNSALKKRGANVGEESMHLEGKAADIHIDEATEEAVRDYAIAIGRGGVGYYPSLDFVHIDTGDVRKWSLPDHPGRLLVAFAKGPEWQVMTSKNVYLPKEKVDYEILNITRTERTLNKRPYVQRFYRGKWEEYSIIDHCSDKKFKAGETCKGELEMKKEAPFGKFRIVMPEEGYSHLSSLSNEFYRKAL